MENCCGTGKGGGGMNKCSPCKMVAIVMIIVAIVILGVKLLGH